jgi:hypothetical protein
MRSVGSGGVGLESDVEAELLDFAGEASGVGLGILTPGEVIDPEFQDALRGKLAAVSPSGPP